MPSSRRAAAHLRAPRRLVMARALRGVTAARGLLALGLYYSAACGGGQMVCKPDPITGSEQCQTASSDPTTAIVNTGVAAGVYGVTGCTVNGCQLPDECNPKTKRCQTIRCREGRPCPSGYSCDMVTLMCR